MKKNEGYTVVEIVISSAIFLILTLSYVGASMLLQETCYGSIAAQELQRNADIIMGYMVKNGPGERVDPTQTNYITSSCKGLRSAVSYDIPVDSVPPNSRIIFTGIDGVARAYYLENGASRIRYQSPTISEGAKTVYTAPLGTTILLEFTPVHIGQHWDYSPDPPDYRVLVDNPPDGETVGIHIALTRTMRGKTYSGSLWAYVNLKNCPK